MGLNRKGRFFRKGIERLERFDARGAARAFLAGMRREECSRSADWFPYTLLLRSRYRELSEALKTKPRTGYTSYSDWWFRFMTGEIDALPAATEGMLESDNYFLRIYGVWRWSKRSGIRDASDALREKTARGGLTFEMHLEEKRAGVYLALLEGNAPNAAKYAWANLREYPNHSETLVDLFEALSASGETAATRALLDEKAVKRLANRDLRVKYLSSRERYRLGDYAGAIRDLHRLLLEFRHHPLFRYNLGNAHYARGEKLRALISWEEAARCAPLFERAWYNAGTICQEAGDVEHAATQLSEAVRLGKRADAIYNLSVSCIERKELDAAYYHLARLPEEGGKYGAEAIRARIRELLVRS